MECIDQLNRIVFLKKTPLTIISLVPSQTELLVDLGLRNKIVGITKFCVHPKDLRAEKMIVGGTKKVNYDKIKSLNPDIIICNKEENTEEMVLVLENIAPVWISDIKDISDSLWMISQLGKIFDVSEKAEEVISKINKELIFFHEEVQNLPVKKVCYLIWKDPYMAAGKNTFIDYLLRINRFKNVIIDEQSRYPEVQIKDFDEAEMILLSTEPFPFKESDVEIIKKEFNKDIKLVDGEYFSWYGSRLIKSFQYFKELHKLK
jgi:ABC-type Fe3+-hydroxamate transport system substrate-binding protein